MQDGDQPQEPAPESTEVEQNLGLMLQAARDAQGLTVEDIAAELRIEARLLHALEEARFEELGAPVFAKGYLKQYGQKLGLEYKELLSEYYRIVEPRDVEISVSSTIKLRDERQIMIWVIAALALALVAVFLFVWWVGGPQIAATGAGSLEPAATTAAVEAAPAAFEASPDAAETAPAAAESTPAAAEASPAAAETTPADVSEPAQSAPSPESSAQARSEPEPPGAAELEARPAAVQGQPVAVAPIADESLVLVEIAFLEDCWVEMTDGAGERLFYGLGQAGTLSSFRATAPIRFFLGNAEGVELSVDGRGFAIPSAGRRGNLANFTVYDSAD